MLLLLTTVLPLLAHDHASAIAFLTCRYHNFHASIIPEFLSDEERVQSFCEARQHNHLYYADKGKQYANLYNLFVQTPLMQFSPSLIVSQKDCNETLIKPLLETKYFTRSLQRCTFYVGEINNDLLQALSKVQSLTELDLRENKVENEHLEIVINSFPSLETLTIGSTAKIVNPAHVPAHTMKTLRSLTIRKVDASFVTQFVPCFPNLRKLVLSGTFGVFEQVDLLRLSSSLPLLTDLSLENFRLQNDVEKLQENLVHLSSLQLLSCNITSELTFLFQENSLPELRTFCINGDVGELTHSAVASLAHAKNLRTLEIHHSDFDNDCLQYLENMIHLRKLSLNSRKVTGEAGSLNTLMKNILQLEELNLECCHIGNQGEIAGALYSTHSRLRVLNLKNCDLVDDDLIGIDALKNTLECLYLNGNRDLTNEGLVHCKDLLKLKILDLTFNDGLPDLAPLQNCSNLEELNVSGCYKLTDDSFRVFSEEPNSFPNLRALNLTYCNNLTEKVFEHLAKNNNIVHRLKELNATVLREILMTSSSSTRNNVCQLQGLQKLVGVASTEEIELKTELIRRLKNLEELE